MIIILKKDGQIVTDDGNPVEGAKLENAAAVLADPNDGDTIVYNATAGMWVAGTGGGSFEPDITNPQDGDTLVYDASEEKWVNGSGGGSGGGFLKVGTDMQTLALDKTWKEIHDALNAGYFIISVLSDGTTSYQYTINKSEITVSERGDYEYSLNMVAIIDNSTNNVLKFATDSENGYPVMQQNG